MSSKSVFTLSDVAKRAGVSKMTASAVLNSSRSNTRVSETTRQRILAIAAEMQYRPNAIARSLTRRHTNVIGFYSGYGFVDARNVFLAEITGGLLAGCEQYRKDLLTHGIFRGHSVDDIFAELSNGMIDGLVVHAPHDDPLVDRLAASHLPVVAVADAVPALPSVVVDDVLGSRLLAAHLAGKGHRRVLYRTAFFHATSTQRRLESLERAAASAGMTVVPSQVADPVGNLSGAEREILSAPAAQRPTAAVCWEDGSAFCLLSECRRLGLHVPDDLAIVGFNGIASPVVPLLRLTTVRAPWGDVAQTAVALVVSQLEGKEVPSETVLPVELIVGETT